MKHKVRQELTFDPCVLFPQLAEGGPSLKSSQLDSLFIRFQRGGLANLAYGTELLMQAMGGCSFHISAEQFARFF
jgi:hypothetical protein